MAAVMQAYSYTPGDAFGCRTGRWHLRRPFMFAMVVALLASPVVAQAPLPIDRARVIALSASVLRVEVQRAQGGYSMGSGVVLTADRIVTNCHVTRDALAIHVLRGGARWRAEAQVATPELDLCVLRVPSMKGTPVSMAAGDALNVGQGLAALGFVGGVEKIQASFGQLVDTYRHAGGDVIQSSTTFTSGASGGGLFNADGALVGILTFRSRGGAAHYFAAPTAWLTPMMVDKSADRPVSPQRPVTLAYWERSAEHQPRFLQALALEQQQDWRELATLTAAWRTADGTDPHARRWHRQAQTQLCLTTKDAASCP